MITLDAAALGLTQESRLSGNRRLVWALLILGTAFLLVPRVEGWTLLHVHKEDGIIFLADFVNDGWSSLFDPYTGYQHLVPRFIAGICASGPPEAFAACAGVGASLIRVTLAVVALAVLTPYARSPRWAAVAASAFIWAPVGQQEALANLTNLRWFLDAGAVLLLMGVWRRPSAIGIAALLAIGAAMSDPLAVVIAPLALWRLGVLSGRARLVPAVFLASAMTHYLMLDRSARTSQGSMYIDDPGDSSIQLLVRGIGVPVFGQNGTELLLIVGVPLAVLAVCVVLGVAVSSSAWSPTTAMALILSVFGVGLLTVTLTFADMSALGLDPAWQLGHGSRYSVAPGVLVAIGLVLVLSSALDRTEGILRLGVYALLCAFPLAVLADSPGDSWNTADPTWAAELQASRLACAAGQQSTRVQMTPADVPMDWSADLRCDWLMR